MTLVKPIKFGGLNISDEKSIRILAIANKKKESKEKKNEIKKEKVDIKTSEDGTKFLFKEKEVKENIENKSKKVKLEKVARDVDYDLKSILEKKISDLEKKEEIKKPEPVIEKKEEIKKPEPVIEKKEEIKKPEPVVEKKEEIKQTITKITSSKKSIQRRSSLIRNGKKSMQDIKKAPKIMGPIDELHYMDLVTFRRMDVSVENRIKKIIEKIALLEKEGIDKKIEGVKAWRMNPINRLYLQTGHESIASGKSVEEVIEDRKYKNRDYLKMEEFEAIMEINNRLRF